MTRQCDEIEEAIEVFVRGFCAGKSVTHPYEHCRVGKLWVMRDAPRKNVKNYRKEEWIAYGVEPHVVDAAARQQTRGRFFVCAIRGVDEADDGLRASYKELGYRLLATEPLFVHRLKRIPPVTARSGKAQPRSTVVDVVNHSHPFAIEQVRTQEMAVQFGKATRSRPIAAECLANGARFRQYIALDDGAIVGWVRSVDAGDSTWCSNMYIRPSHRRRGIARALLATMLRDDRQRGAKQSVLLSSHTGALVYPRVGYEQIGLLFIFAPKRTRSS